MSLASLVTSHFEELKRELDGFTELFLEWTDQRRRVLMDDKEAYLRTLSEEQGIDVQSLASVPTFM